MKQYHTAIIIDASIEKVWKHLTEFSSYPAWNPLVRKLGGQMIEGNKISTYIVPLGKTYYPKLLAFKPYKELTWQGVQGAKFLMAGKHYYRLEEVSAHQTKLLHSEWFTGVFSWFISHSLLQKMENAFIEHNSILKKRVEDER